MTALVQIAYDNAGCHEPTRTAAVHVSRFESLQQGQCSKQVMLICLPIYDPVVVDILQQLRYTCDARFDDRYLVARHLLTRSKIL